MTVQEIFEEEGEEAFREVETAVLQVQTISAALMPTLCCQTLQIRFTAAPTHSSSPSCSA
jgi:hypothetical protein